MCGSKKICHSEFTNVSPCGCCPCNWQYYPVVFQSESIAVADLMEYAKSTGQRLHLQPNSAPGEGPIRISFEKMPERASKNRPGRTRALVQTKNSSNNPKPTIKITKKANTQSERTTARKMKMRQLHQDKIATKRANTAATNNPLATKNELTNDSTQADVVGVGAHETNEKIMNKEKKRPKTHFRKTKKPGRA